MRRLAGTLLAVPVLVATALPLGAAADPLDPVVCPASGPRVCFVDASETPRVTIPAGAADTTYLHVTATVTNQGTSTATHFTLTDVPPAGVGVVALAGVDGAGRGADCTVATATCSYSNLAAGRSATIDAVLAVSASAVPSSTTVPNLNTITARVDEGTNDSPGNGGKVDTTPLARPLNLVTRDGTSVYSYLPAGPAATLTTDRNGKPFTAATSDATGNEVGTTQIPAGLTQAVYSSVHRSDTGAACPGTCAMADWLEVSLPGFPDISPAGSVLRTTLRVDSSLVAKVKGLNANSVVVWYQPDLGTPAALPRCSASAASNCFTAQKEKDGDLTVVVTEPHNGRMRL
jgi:hypothetical protein